MCINVVDDVAWLLTPVEKLSDTADSAIDIALIGDSKLAEEDKNKKKQNKKQSI